MKTAAATSSCTLPAPALAVEPCRVRQALAALALDDSDDALLNYFHFFTQNVPVTAAYFLHAIPGLNIFLPGSEADEAIGLGELRLRNERLASMRASVEKCFSPPNGTSFEFDVREGDPLEAVLEEAEMMEADLVVAGQSTQRNRHGILAKNLARKVTCSALVVPGQAKPVLKKIIVPVDFSSESASALRTAVALARRMPKLPKVVALHICDLPVYGDLRIGFSEETLGEAVISDRREAFKAFLAEHLAPEDMKLVKMALAERHGFSTGEEIMEYVAANKGDLLAMGTRGHSKVHLLLMGSVTEKVLSLTKRTPVLVVKN